MVLKITACPRCGSTQISAGRMGSGIMFGITSWKEECRDCGYQGAPIIFNSPQEYEKFITKLRKEKQAKSKTSEKELQKTIQTSDNYTEMISERDQTVVKFFNELAEQESQGYIEGNNELFKPWYRKKNWWFEIALAVVIALVLTYSTISNNLHVLGLEVSVVYSILFFVFEVIAVLVGIIIVEYFFLFVRSAIKR